MNKKGFTLVELIVVITILAILWTIAFISFQGYSKDSRNSVRISDVWVIEKALSLNELNSWFFPEPENMEIISYSWATLFKQGKFWSRVLWNLEDLNKLPLDPLYNSSYDYSISYNSKKFQLYSMIEWGLFSWWNISYLKWNYLWYDLPSKDWNNCYLITIPSLYISNLPVWWDLSIGEPYSFVYSDSSNLTNQYLSRVNWYNDDFFQIYKTLDSCSINSVDELNIYISKLSVYYQQLIWNQNYDNIIYEYINKNFARWLIDFLLANWIKIDKNIIAKFMNPWSGYIFRDSFIWNDWTDITLWYQSDTLWTWSWNTSYQISWNSLLKTVDWNWIINAIPTWAINSIDRTIVFKVSDLSWWPTTVYSNYIDSNNYQWVEISSTWYKRLLCISWTCNTLDDVLTSINDNSYIEFWVVWNNFNLSINNIDQWTIVVTPLTLNWDITINMSLNNKLDDFTLIYK